MNDEVFKKSMQELYTCICGEHEFLIMKEAKICCNACGKEYDLEWTVGIDGELDSPEEFNQRIRKEEARAILEGK